jgi:hypothetical protein
MDTAGSFSATRLQGLLAQSLLAAVAEQDADVLDGFVEEACATCLSNVSVHRCSDLLSLHDTLGRLHSAWLSAPPTAPLLVVLDSITAVAAPVLGGIDTSSAHAALSTVGLALCRIAQECELAVVVINSTVSDRGTPGTSGSMPALGSTWSGVPSVRLWLDRLGNDTSVTVLRHHRQPADRLL